VSTLVVDAGAAAAPGAPGLAGLLRHFERAVEADAPELVVLEDDSDAALAAALVAVKLLIPVEARPRATEPASVNARLIAQLAGT
jgi:hypothetical protein